MLPSPSMARPGSPGAPRLERPDPEMLERAHRRVFSAAYKLRILGEADACARGTLGALLRREGLYSLQLATWRQ